MAEFRFTNTSNDPSLKLAILNISTKHQHVDIVFQEGTDMGEMRTTLKRIFDHSDNAWSVSERTFNHPLKARIEARPLGEEQTPQDMNIQRHFAELVNALVRNEMLPADLATTHMLARGAIRQDLVKIER